MTAFARTCWRSLRPPAKADLLGALEELVDRETDRNPSLLSKDPRVAATLIEGVGERSDIYGKITQTVSALLDKLIQEQGLPKMREHRIQEVGAEVAAEEEKRGSKTEEQWQQESDARRSERQAKLEQERERERERERAEKAKKEERKRRQKEEEEAREKKRQEEKEERRKAREAQQKEDEDRRRKKRERIEREEEEERARLKKEREEHEASREERLRKIREEDREREKRIEAELAQSRSGRSRGGRGRSRSRSRDRDRGRDKDRDYDRDYNRERRRSKSRSRSRERIRSVRPEDIKVDDDLALQLLLQESEAMKRSRQRPALDRSESLEPPLKKAQPPRALFPRDPVAARLSKLDSKPHSPATHSPSKEPPTPTTPALANKDEDTPMEDAPPLDDSAKSRWDRPPPLKPEKSRGHSRSHSVAHSSSARKRSRTRSRSRGSRHDRRSSIVEDDRRARREDRRSQRPYDNKPRDRDDRGDRDNRQRSRSRDANASRRKSRVSRSPEHRGDRNRRTSRSRSRDGHRARERSPARSRRIHSRSKSPEIIDRYIPRGGEKRDDNREQKRDSSRDRKRSDSRDRKRNDSRDRKRDSSRNRRRDDSRDRPRNYRSREYDRWDAREGGARENRDSRGTRDTTERSSRFQDSDRYVPGGTGGDDKDDNREPKRDRKDRGGKTPDGVAAGQGVEIVETEDAVSRGRSLWLLVSRAEVDLPLARYIMDPRYNTYPQRQALQPQPQVTERQHQRFSWQAPLDVDTTPPAQRPPQYQQVHHQPQQPVVNTNVASQHSRGFSYAPTPIEHNGSAYYASSADNPTNPSSPVFTPIDDRPQSMFNMLNTPARQSQQAHGPSSHPRDDDTLLSPSSPEAQTLPFMLVASLHNRPFSRADMHGK
ncbi:hypothetical protein OPT61_g10097 [Boeremia exigua]|uniref:Uncharacterized protein n=1 Tax=Boeremia exigua TaxID=749465 RepID=A0ACC2HRG3_9PLEO|nr:hypothetical protein OPT61_g10097 [Boeremia exigua]